MSDNETKALRREIKHLKRQLDYRRMENNLLRSAAVAARKHIQPGHMVGFDDSRFIGDTLDAALDNSKRLRLEAIDKDTDFKRKLRLERKKARENGEYAEAIRMPSDTTNGGAE